MAHSFNYWQEFHAKRGHHKAKDYRNAFRDVRVRITPEGATFHWKPSWRKEELLLATMTRDNKLTMQADLQDSFASKITLTDRISKLTGVPTAFDRRSHGRYESVVRFFTSTWGSDYKRTPRYAWTDKLNLPYHPGFTFQLDNTGKVESIVHMNPDKRIRVNPDMAKKTKADTTKIRKLTRVMARMGAFDQLTQQRMEQRWNFAKPKSISDVNFTDPSGEDAEIVFANGLVVTQPASGYEYNAVTQQYDRVSPEQMRNKTRERAVENGMKMLREHIYQTQNGYEAVEV